MNMERATQDGYITHRSIHESNRASTFMIIHITHNPTILALELWTWKELHKMVTSHTDQYTKTIMHQPSWSYASRITQPFWHWSYEHGKSYTRWLHHTPINTRKQSCINLHDHTHQAITEPSWHWSYEHEKSYTRWLHHTPVNTRKQSCINLHDHRHQA